MDRWGEGGSSLSPSHGSAEWGRGGHQHQPEKSQKLRGREVVCEARMDRRPIPIFSVGGLASRTGLRVSEVKDSKQGLEGALLLSETHAQPRSSMRLDQRRLNCLSSQVSGHQPGQELDQRCWSRSTCPGRGRGEGKLCSSTHIPAAQTLHFPDQ